MLMSALPSVEHRSTLENPSSSAAMAAWTTSVQIIICTCIGRQNVGQCPATTHQSLKRGTTHRLGDVHVVQAPMGDWPAILILLRPVDLGPQLPAHK
jgi:hypothetical protein